MVFRPIKTLLAVFPHPDDEAVMAGGLMQKALASGVRVVSLCLTAGEMGKMHIHGHGRSVSEVRREEYRKALTVIGIKEFHIWHYKDGYLAQYSDWQKPLWNTLSTLQPDLVVTYGPNGLSGHPDHIAVSKFLYKKLPRLEQLLWVGETESYKKMMRPGSLAEIKGKKRN